MKARTQILALIGAMTISGVAGYAVAQIDQPHMRNALVDLQSAAGELSVAQMDKGGHRAAALTLVNQAISQVQQGIAYAGN
jgi:hypothetical protein